MSTTAAMEGPDSLGPFDNPVLNEAKAFFDRCNEWESDFRLKFIDDVRFANGDSENNYQWPNRVRQARTDDQRPCLTINIIRQHNLQIVNDTKQNKSGMAVRATGGLATAKSANIYTGLIKQIEYRSQAQDAYGLGQAFQVTGGYGVWRLSTDYSGPDTFDQEVRILPVLDPLSVFFDPDAKQKDKSDGRKALVFDDVPRDQFEEAYPEFTDLEGLSPMGVGAGDDDWLSSSHVRVCEYFRVVSKRDILISFIEPGSRKRKAIRKSLLPPEVAKVLLKDPLTRTRSVSDESVEWKLIVGNKLVDETTWPGKYIPLVPVIGEETRIEGQLDRKGHTRSMKDAQRMYNYNASSQVEFVALQGKTPWLAPARAIEELEQYWNTANTANHSVLPWNHVDDEGNPIPPPVRTEPPNASMAYAQGMDTSFNQMMMASGQWQNQMGMGGNERTGSAIQQRQQQGDRAVFHFYDNYMDALAYTARQIIDLVPKVYDTKRVLRIIGDDGADLEVEMDPAAQQAYVEHARQDGVVLKRIFNPAVGEYDVVATAGQAYGTKREETVNALTLILTQNPGLTGIVGDLLLKAMDFPEAQEAAQRLRRMVPAQALGQGPSPAELQMQERIGALSAALSKSLERQGKDAIKLVGKEEMRDIDAYKAETDRIKALVDSLPLDQPGLESLVHQLVGDAMQTHLTEVTAANAGQLSAMREDEPPPEFEPPPLPGAQKDTSGQWYLADPTRRGKYLRVGPLAQQHTPAGQSDKG